MHWGWHIPVAGPDVICPCCHHTACMMKRDWKWTGPSWSSSLLRSFRSQKLERAVRAGQTTPDPPCCFPPRPGQHTAASSSPAEWPAQSVSGLNPHHYLHPGCSTPLLITRQQQRPRKNELWLTLRRQDRPLSLATHLEDEIIQGWSNETCTKTRAALISHNCLNILSSQILNRIKD